MIVPRSLNVAGGDKRLFVLNTRGLVFPNYHRGLWAIYSKVHQLFSNFTQNPNQISVTVWNKDVLKALQVQTTCLHEIPDLYPSHHLAKRLRIPKHRIFMNNPRHPVGGGAAGSVWETCLNVVRAESQMKTKQIDAALVFVQCFLLVAEAD